MSSILYCRYVHPPSGPTKTTLKESLFKYTQHGRYHARRYLSVTISHGYIFNGGNYFCFLKSTPRTHSTINRSVVGYLFATYWFYILFFFPFHHSHHFQCMQILHTFGIRSIDCSIQSYVSEVSIWRLPASYLC